MYLADEAWPDLRTYFEQESLALIPLGSTEQHGPHLPESTDHVIAESLAREAAARTGYLCTPTVNVGISRHHRQFPGTMWVSPDAFRTYVRELTENLTYHGIDRVVYVNAHGGNVDALREVAKDLHADGTCYALEWMWDESIPGLVDELFEHNGPHGGPKETAMLQHLTDRVHEDRLAEARDGGTRDVWNASGTSQNGAATYFDARDNSENGVFGDQTDATAEKGERLFEAATEQLTELSEWLAAREESSLTPADRVASEE
ncbi:creatininase family protein [Halosegnis longus]|uniref:Creatininase family protein n=1 Tax=Halosegnis longus TaxID=2216012 RepID=A0AAJ4RA02_9EURY|nr:creatininase family protein [Halosegnis longus]RNJ26897.1 creatininase family protein [Salella cibi]